MFSAVKEFDRSHGTTNYLKDWPFDQLKILQIGVPKLTSSTASQILKRSRSNQRGEIFRGWDPKPKKMLLRCAEGLRKTPTKVIVVVVLRDSFSERVCAWVCAWEREWEREREREREREGASAGRERGKKSNCVRVSASGLSFWKT